MRFGPATPEAAIGAYLAHAVSTPAGTVRKGTRVDAALAAALIDAAIKTVTVARLEPDDVHEDEAAAALAHALAGPNVRAEAPATGRSNLFAAAAGLFVLDPDRIHAINRIDPAVTVATRPPLRGVEAGRMVATVKIIPFAVGRAVLDAAIRMAGGAPALAVEAYRPLRVAVVSTLLPSLKSKVVEKTLSVLADRLRPAGATITADLRVPHDDRAVAEALASVRGKADLTVVFGASAVVDADDVIPAAIRAAGGTVVHLGMPVDPGNLLILGALDGRPVLGAPGCARSPRENGFDFVLERLLADHPVGADDIVRMGVGGLLMDIVSRPAPRTGDALKEDPDRPAVAAIVLAAGRSTRFGPANKLLAPVRGAPMVRHAAKAALASSAAEVIVVTGHEAEAVEAALADLPRVRLVRNPAYREGQSTSLRAGLQAVSPACEAAIVLLGDMPAVDAALVDRLIAAYRPLSGSLIVMPVHEGRRGNPVLWSRRFFQELAAIEGDQGGRTLLTRYAEAVAEVEAGPAAHLDLDDPKALSDHDPQRPARSDQDPKSDEA
ncbi:NTP transferase domain-containing protein [Mongoliimonas terrestris]|uniref:NTP transferase domain-containing protein n=1 Tax=Mongoliimonas terrestris TaxID=1709001 RepID=UPI0009495642|nr:molybdopterin-binding/glycosyltransferase family 2 protein [Mongoliimonas terrestris]